MRWCGGMLVLAMALVCKAAVEVYNVLAIAIFGVECVQVCAYTYTIIAAVLQRRSLLKCTIGIVGL